MTVALGNEFNIGPAVSAGGTGAPGGAAGLPGGALASSGRAAAEGFLARWRLELAAMRSAGESDGGDGQKQAGAPAILETAGANPPAVFQAGSANGPGAVRSPERDSASAGSGDAPPEAGPAPGAESLEGPESRQRPTNREPGTKDGAQGAAKNNSRPDSRAVSQGDSPKDGPSQQLIAGVSTIDVSMAGASMSSVPTIGVSIGVSAAIAPLAPAQQQMRLLAPAAKTGAGILAAPAGASAAGKASGAVSRRMAAEGGPSAAAAQPLEGFLPGGSSSAAAGRPALAADGGSLAAEGSDGPAVGNHEGGPRNGSLIGSDSEDGGPAMALSAAAGQGLQSAGAGMQGGAGPSTAAAASAGAADAGRDAVSASRPARGANAGPHPEQGAGQAGATPVAAQMGHEGGIAIMPAVAATGGAHGIPAQPAGSAGMAGSSPVHSAERSAGEAFAAMDAQSDSPAVTWMHAGRDRAEAGFEDPALGWVAVRAEMGAGGVHAAIMPGTAEAAQALGGHMAGLSAHLAEQRVAVSAISMNSPGNSPAIAPQLAGGGAGENGGQQWAGRGQQQPAQSGASQAAAGVDGAAAKAPARAAGGEPPVAPPSGMTGSYISVVA